MPRFVRPAYIRVTADGTRTESSTGPRSAGGSLTATLTLRTADADVSAPIILRAGGKFADGTGRVEVSIPRGFAVSIVDADGTETVYAADAIRSLTVRPIA